MARHADGRYVAPCALAGSFCRRLPPRRHRGDAGQRPHRRARRSLAIAARASRPAPAASGETREVRDSRRHGRRVTTGRGRARSRQSAKQVRAHRTSGRRAHAAPRAEDLGSGINAGGCAASAGVGDASWDLLAPVLRKPWARLNRYGGAAPVVSVYRRRAALSQSPRHRQTAPERPQRSPTDSQQTEASGLSASAWGDCAFVDGYCAANPTALVICSTKCG